MINIYVLILLCALVTFIPRLIPAIAVDKLNFGPKFEKFCMINSDGIMVTFASSARKKAEYVFS